MSVRRIKATLQCGILNGLIPHIDGLSRSRHRPDPEPQEEQEQAELIQSLEAEEYIAEIDAHHLDSLEGRERWHRIAKNVKFQW